MRSRSSRQHLLPLAFPLMWIAMLLVSVGGSEFAHPAQASDVSGVASCQEADAAHLFDRSCLNTPLTLAVDFDDERSPDSSVADESWPRCTISIRAAQMSVHAISAILPACDLYLAHSVLLL